MSAKEILTAPCQYRIVSEVLASYDCDKYIAYGIEVFAEHKDKSVVYSTVSDISTDKIQVAEMVEKFNDFELSPVHFLDVIEDMLA